MVASVLLHEMAHMWFGDLVTMQWWDDLWLNEAFASWAATWGASSATRVHRRLGDVPGAVQARRATRWTWAPRRHPIRGDVPDVAQAMANFDAITYIKGESVLKQLVAYVGEDAFVEGLRAYFRDHAWGNTRLDDLMSAPSARRRGPRPVRLDRRVVRPRRHRHPDAPGRGRPASPSGPTASEPRPHRFDIGSYRRDRRRAELA